MVEIRYEKVCDKHHVMTITINELRWFWIEPLVSTQRFDQYALTSSGESRIYLPLTKPMISAKFCISNNLSWLINLRKKINKTQETSETEDFVFKCYGYSLNWHWVPANCSEHEQVYTECIWSKTQLPPLPQGGEHSVTTKTTKTSSDDILNLIQNGFSESGVQFQRATLKAHKVGI